MHCPYNNQMRSGVEIDCQKSTIYRWTLPMWELETVGIDHGLSGVNEMHLPFCCDYLLLEYFCILIWTEGHSFILLEPTP